MNFFCLAGRRSMKIRECSIFNKMEKKINKMKIRTMLALFLGMTVCNLFAQYKDVGDDPERLKIIGTTEISILDGYEFKQWSPDGDFFTVSNASYQAEEFKTYIFKKSGQLYKQYEGYFTLWSPDSKKIVLMDTAMNVWIFDIMNNEQAKTSIKTGTFYNIHQFIDDKIIYSKDNEVFEYDTKSNNVALIFKSQNTGILHYVKEHGDCLCYTQCLNLNEKPFYIYNMIDKKATQIQSGYIEPLRYYLTKDDKLIISCIDSEILFLDEKGSVLFKFSDRLNGEEDSRPDMGFDILNSSLAPNGKLYAISYRQFHASEDIINSSDIYLFSLVSGKKYKLTNTVEKTELMKGWSPQGNRIVYLEFKSKKLIIAEIG